MFHITVHCSSRIARCIPLSVLCFILFIFTVFTLSSLSRLLCKVRTSYYFTNNPLSPPPAPHPLSTPPPPPSSPPSSHHHKHDHRHHLCLPYTIITTARTTTSSAAKFFPFLHHQHSHIPQILFIYKHITDHSYLVISLCLLLFASFPAPHFLSSFAVSYFFFDNLLTVPHLYLVLCIFTQFFLMTHYFAIILFHSILSLSLYPSELLSAILLTGAPIFSPQTNRWPGAHFCQETCHQAGGWREAHQVRMPRPG